MSSFVTPKRATQFIFYVGLVSQANRPQFQATPTLAAGDVLVATDDGAPGNITTLPVVDADFTKRIKVTLSIAEMTGDNITVIFSDAAGDEWDDLVVDIQTTAQQIDDLAPVSEYDTEMARITANVATEAKQDIMDTNVDDIETILGTPANFMANVAGLAPANEYDATLATILTDTNELQTDDVPGLIAALNDITVANILAGIIEGTLTLQQTLRLALAVLTGEASGGGTSSIAFRDVADSKDRVVMTVTSAGDRSAVVLDGS